jgi:cell division protein FtsI (penicillin-binding protein 3)
MWRHHLLVILFIAAVVGLCGRVVFLSVTDRAFLQGQGDARSIRNERIPGMRGVIYDRHGRALAVSTPVFSVSTDPSRAQFDERQMDTLAELLNQSVSTLQARIANVERKFVYLKRRVSWHDAEKIRAAKLDHVYLQSEYRRYYPAAETAAHLVGVTNIDDKGVEGSEYAFDQQLKGRDGRKTVLKDLHGNIIRDLQYKQAPVFGQDLNLSIDLRLQFLAYRELKSAIVSHGAKSGSLVILEVQSGEVLALVNQPSYNPNDIPSQLQGMRNRAITDTYEPGSTIKPFAALAALESGRYDRRTVIDTSPGYLHVGAKLISDPVNYEVLTLAESLAKSSQVAFVKVALDLEEDAVFDVIQRAGIGEPVGTGLPGEQVGFLDGSQLRYPQVRMALAYGYGLSLTPLQMAQAYLTLATAGEKMAVSMLHRPDRTPERERVFDKRIVQEVVSMMEGVTLEGGTAQSARVPGYRVAGKTGTARIVGPSGYDDERHVAWFAGLVPVSDPRLVVVVLVNDPKAGLSGGGAVAAPVFARVAQRSLRLLGVPADAQVAAAPGSGDKVRG